MVSDETDQHPMGEQPELMDILPYKLTTTKDKSTSRTGLKKIRDLGAEQALTTLYVWIWEIYRIDNSFFNN